jgi:hypothetical protein
MTVRSPLSSANDCTNACLRSAHKAAVNAAWKALGPLVARSSNKASIAAVDSLLVGTPGSKWLLISHKQLKGHLTTIASSLGVNYNSQVYGCKI